MFSSVNIPRATRFDETLIATEIIDVEIDVAHNCPISLSFPAVTQIVV